MDVGESVLMIVAVPVLVGEVVAGEVLFACVVDEECRAEDNVDFVSFRSSFG